MRYPLYRRLGGAARNSVTLQNLNTCSCEHFFLKNTNTTNYPNIDLSSSITLYIRENVPTFICLGTLDRRLEVSMHREDPVTGHFDKEFLGTPAYNHKLRLLQILQSCYTMLLLQPYRFKPIKTNPRLSSPPNYTGWSISLCAPDDYSTKNTQKKMAITEYSQNVNRAILNTVFENTVWLVNKCLETGGGHFEHYL
jgi:hypothetical protein